MRDFGDVYRVACDNMVKMLLFIFHYKARTGRKSTMPKMFTSGSLDLRMQQQTEVFTAGFTNSGDEKEN